MNKHSDVTDSVHINPIDLHTWCVENNIYELKFRSTLDHDIIYTYIYITRHEFQIFRANDMPTNYVVQAVIQNRLEF